MRNLPHNPPAKSAASPRSLLILLFAVLVAPRIWAGPATPEQLVFFETKVRPLLLDNCVSCHGEKKQKGGLRLDSKAALLKGGKNGVVLVPGKPDSSRLVQAISYTDEDLQMPPDGQLTPDQVRILTQWVAMDAPWSDAAMPAAPAKSKHHTITDVDRAFWSFQPVKDSTPPALTAADQAKPWPRNPVDHFILAKLQAEGLTPSPEADRAALIRRATFDLHGLPPTPQEVDAFVHDPAPDAYDKLIDRLLASPRYGEHWARHWLDLVRYAESDGFKQDAYRSNAWPYRDYVIKSFNDDKPYDRFVREQLAGDEIAPNDSESLIATGYLRHGGYEYNQRDVPKQWSQMLDDVTDVTGDVFLGLSMGCARCHDHKFDPILQADYYRLRAFFAPMLPRDDLSLETAAQKVAYEKKLAAWNESVKPLRDKMAVMEKSPANHGSSLGVIKKFPADMQAILNKPSSDRTPLEEQLAQLAYRQIRDPSEGPQPKFFAADKEKYEALKKQFVELEADKPRPPLHGFVATDVGPVAPPMSIPGDDAHPLDPAYLTVLDHQSLEKPAPAATSSSTGRRTALAAWLTQPSHPLTSRVMVNRLWQYHFGRGLVATSSDFGRLGTPPTHPELLDYLATRFVAGGWSVKAMHRLILTSATYRQTALGAMSDAARLKDPENRWLWRMNTRRLDAEQIRDAILTASGELQLDAGGPSAEPTAPRRSIFTKVLRNTRDPLLEAFDAPESFGSVPQRNVTTTPNQALFLINGDWPLKRAAALAVRVSREAKNRPPEVLVETAYRLAYGRKPSTEETAAAVEFLSPRQAACPCNLPTNQ